MSFPPGPPAAPERPDGYEGRHRKELASGGVVVNFSAMDPLEVGRQVEAALLRMRRHRGGAA